MQDGSADMSEHTDTVKNTLDSIAIFTTFGSFLQLLNPFFALIGAVVGAMRIYEMVSGKNFYELFRRKKPDASDK